MGICFPVPLIEERVYYKYQSIPIQDLQVEIRSGNNTCFLCKQMITHEYVSTTKCNKCDQMIGHSRCVSIWRLNQTTCPLCSK